MKKLLIVGIVLGAIMGGCTVKKVVKPSGATYEQQQNSFQKANSSLDNN